MIVRLVLFALTFTLAPLRAADLAGFPFQDETLRYNVNWPSGLSLGEAVFTAHKAASGGWTFEASFNVGVPGFPIADKYKSTVGAEYCAVELRREISHGTKKVVESTAFDQKGGHATRQTLVPAGGGKSELDIPSCARDALAFEYFARKELGQGRVPPAGKVFFGSGYQVGMQYTGEQKITVAGKPAVTDRVSISLKGPASSSTFEVFYARDAARTPLLVKIPVAVGTISLELAR